MKSLSKFLLIFITVSFFNIEVKGQYAIKNISNVDGLSNSSINCIFEDSKKLLWIGTWDGLNTYDGREIKVYKFNRNNLHSISNNVIRQICEQNEQYIWVNTDNGFNRFDRQAQTFQQFLFKSPNQITITAKQRVVGCVGSQHLVYLNEETKEFIPVKNEKPFKSIRRIICTSADILYILSDKKLYMYKISYNGDNSVRIEDTGVTPIEGIDDIYKEGDTVYLNYGNAVGVINRQIYSSHLFTIPAGSSISFMTVRNHTIYLWLNSGVCYVYKEGSNRSFFIDDIPEMQDVFSIYAGSQDILWIGTDGQGVFCVYPDNSLFKTIKTNNPVRAFCERDNGELLIGTKGEGIKVFDKKSGKINRSYTENDGLISNYIYSIKKNKKGDIFIGTEGSELNILKNGSNKIEQLQLPDKSFSSIYCITFTNEDSCIWLGSVGRGILKATLKAKNNMYIVEQPQYYTSQNGKNSLGSNTVYSMVRNNRDDELWVGARYGGVSKILTHTGTVLGLDTILGYQPNMDEDVLALNMGSDNSLWIGTSYGLNRVSFEDGFANIQEYTDKQGLTNNTIHGILEDRNHDMWISTNHGISRINTKTRKITNYTSRDGLQNDEFADCAYYKSNSGLLYFGGVNGVSYFDPGKIHLRDYTPPISLSNLKINNISQNIFERIQENTLYLSYNEAYTTFSLIVHDFIKNENCEYAYRIKGFAEEWIDNYNNPNINITRLPPGKYKLEVKYTNGDRIWSNEIYSLNLVIGYPWWQSPIAYTVYSLIFILIAITILWIIRYRMRVTRKIYIEQLEKQHQNTIHESKLNFFTNIAHEFFTPLTLIYGPAHYLLGADNLDNSSKKYVQIIKNNADRMQKLINELMEFRKVESGYTKIHPEQINMEFLIKYVTDNYIDLAEENKIALNINIQNLSDFVSDRNSIEMILFNLISNAFKYTPSDGRIDITAIQEEQNNAQVFTFIIRNSGKGLTRKQMNEIFDRFKILETTKKAHSGSIGIGLNLTKSLTKLLGGEITVDSALEEYVEFRLRLKSIDHFDKEISENISNITDYPLLDIAAKDISILIVEDDKYISGLLEDILKPYYNINKAYNGEEARIEITKNMPDIIITDIMMPVMNGLELINYMKANEQTAHIPIISISAKSSVDDHIKAFEHGADLYITKPFHPRHILVAVENIINKYSLLKDYYNSGRSSIIVKEGIEIHLEEEQFLQEIISYIEGNIDDETLGPNSLSEFLKISKASLYRKLKELTEKTPSEYIRYIKLKHTAMLLKTSKATITEVMYKSGFSNKSYFFREFAKQYGCTPKEYRDMNG